MVIIGIRGFHFESFFECSINKVHIQYFRLGLGLGQGQVRVRSGLGQGQFRVRLVKGNVLKILKIPSNAGYNSQQMIITFHLLIFHSIKIYVLRDRFQKLTLIINYNYFGVIVIEVYPKVSDLCRRGVAKSKTNSGKTSRQ